MALSVECSSVDQAHYPVRNILKWAKVNKIGAHCYPAKHSSLMLQRGGGKVHYHLHCTLAVSAPDVQLTLASLWVSWHSTQGSTGITSNSISVSHDYAAGTSSNACIVNNDCTQVFTQKKNDGTVGRVSQFKIISVFLGIKPDPIIFFLFMNYS